MTKSIVQNEKECFICKTTLNLHRHHIFEGRNRQNSEEDGLWVYLCAIHHNMSDIGVHFNKSLDNRLKRIGETAWLCQECDRTINDFIKKYKRNYL